MQAVRLAWLQAVRLASLLPAVKVFEIPLPFVNLVVCSLFSYSWRQLKW
jgi:hypothetical protein